MKKDVKKFLIKVLFFINVLLYFYLITPLFISFFSEESIGQMYVMFLFKSPYEYFTKFFQIASIIFWINNLIYIIKHKSGVRYLVLLILLNWLYAPVFYFLYRRNE